MARESVSHHLLCLAGTQRQAGEWESFAVEQTEGFRYTLIGDCWPGEAGGGLTRVGVLWGWFGEPICLSQVGPELGEE